MEHWKRFEENAIVRCKCHRTTFFRVGDGLVSWCRCLKSSSGVYWRPVQGANIHQCKGCGSYEILTGPAESTPAPSMVAA